MTYPASESGEDKATWQKFSRLQSGFQLLLVAFQCDSELPACRHRWMLKTFTNETLDSILCAARGKGEGGQGHLCPQVILKQCGRPAQSAWRETATASLEGSLAGQGIKAASGNEVWGGDWVSVKLEAPSPNAWEASPLSEQHFKGTEEPFWSPHHPSKTKTMSTPDSRSFDRLPPHCGFPDPPGTVLITPAPPPEGGKDSLCPHPSLPDAVSKQPQRGVTLRSPPQTQCWVNKVWS